MNMPAPRVFAPNLIWTTAGDTVLVLNGPGYRIDAYAGGELVASIRRGIPPIDVTADLAAARVGAGPYRGFMRRTGITPDQLVAAVGFEDVASPIEWLAAAPSGRLWVSRGTGMPVPDRVDLFAPDGRYEGSFDAPGFPVAFLSDTQFVALEMTDIGEPVLALYRLAGASVTATGSGRERARPSPGRDRGGTDRGSAASTAGTATTSWPSPVGSPTTSTWPRTGRRRRGRTRCGASHRSGATARSAPGSTG